MSDLSTLVLVAIALFWLWYPGWEDSRHRRRQEDRKHQQWRMDFFLKYGFLPPEDPYDELMEWYHWREHGRGAPY